MSADKSELEECFKAYGIGHVDAHVLAESLVFAGFRKMFDGDCGLSSINDQADREAAEAWMRWANVLNTHGNEERNGIEAMKQMLAEFGYRKRRLVQYVVVTQDGGVYDCSFGRDREAAQAVADEATADAQSAGIDFSYRVAEIVEFTP